MGQFNGAGMFAEIDQYVRQVVGEMASQFGVVQPPVYMSFDIANAQSDGIAVWYNPLWVRSTLRNFCADTQCSASFVVGFLAHEFSHHVHGDALCWNCSRKQQEMRADFEAGRVLARLGIRSEYFEEIIAAINVETTHDPSSSMRADAIRRGFNLQLAEDARPAKTEAASSGWGWAAAALAFLAVVAIASSGRKH